MIRFLKENPIAFSFFVFGMLGFGMLGYLHEQVHVSIFASRGIESEVFYLRFFPDLVTIGAEPCPDQFCRLAHDINEAVGYPLQMIYALIFVGLFYIILLLEEKYNVLLEREVLRL